MKKTLFLIMIFLITICAINVNATIVTISQTDFSQSSNQLIRNGFSTTASSAQWYGQTFTLNTTGTNVTLNNITIVVSENSCTGNIGINLTYANTSNQSDGQIKAVLKDCSPIGVGQNNVTFDFNSTSIPTGTKLLFGVYNNGTANSLTLYGSNNNQSYVNGTCVVKMDGETSQRGNCIGVTPAGDLAFWLVFDMPETSVIASNILYNTPVYEETEQQFNITANFTNYQLNNVSNITNFTLNYNGTSYTITNYSHSTTNTTIGYRTITTPQTSNLDRKSVV